MIFFGKRFREKTVESGSGDLRLFISGEWLFTDDEASQMAGEIFAEYARIFGSAPVRSLRIAIMKFPGTMNYGVWEAETRGEVSLVSPIGRSRRGLCTATSIAATDISSVGYERWKWQGNSAGSMRDFVVQY